MPTHVYNYLITKDLFFHMWVTASKKEKKDRNKSEVKNRKDFVLKEV